MRIGAFKFVDYHWVEKVKPSCRDPFAIGEATGTKSCTIVMKEVEDPLEYFARRNIDGGHWSWYRWARRWKTIIYIYKEKNQLPLSQALSMFQVRLEKHQHIL